VQKLSLCTGSTYKKDAGVQLCATRLSVNHPSLCVRTCDVSVCQAVVAKRGERGLGCHAADEGQGNDGKCDLKYRRRVFVLLLHSKAKPVFFCDGTD